MKFSEFSFFVTDDCNFSCCYCPQTKGKNHMKTSTVEKAVSFFYPYLEEESHIVFFGGEPLLTFEIVKHAVHCLETRNKNKEKKFNFTLTTNGSLLTDPMLSFFNRCGFRIALSFDGLTQESARQSGTLKTTKELIPHISSYSGIKFNINCVCTPATVSQLTASVKYIIQAGGTNIQLNFDETAAWSESSLETLEGELDRLIDYLLVYYQTHGFSPVPQFSPQEDPVKTEGRFACAAGRDRIAISPEEYIWGCILFHPYLKNRTRDEDFSTYSFGKLDDFIINHLTTYPTILENYAPLRQETFFTEKQFCYLCEDVEHCSNCPPYAAFATSLIGKIPTWSCSLNRILRRKKEQFQKGAYHREHNHNLTF